MSNQVVPTVKSFLIADQVFQQTTGKWCIVGIFDRIAVIQFPTVHPALGLYFQLSDAFGLYNVRVEFRDSDDRILSALGGIKLEVKNRLASPGFGIQTGNLPLLAPGKYYFKLFFDDSEVPADISIDVVSASTGG